MTVLCGLAALSGCRVEPGDPPSDPPSVAPASTEPVSEAVASSTPPTPPSTAPAVPTGPIAASTATRSRERDPRTARFLGYTAPKPVTWQWQPPASVMRAANYVTPGRSGSNQAHLIVFRGIGGTTEANIDRWRKRFRGPDGGPVEPVVTEFEAAGLPITLVELSGEWMRMGAQWFTPNQTQIAAIVTTPEGPLHITLGGDSATVALHRDDFLRFLRGLRPETSSDGGGSSERP
ncbi:MAG: hypothetical protein HKO59_07580 [Phycisphaerales bacterium]|nr:hypothetical protein [Phycisphaerales bacterium]